VTLALAFVQVRWLGISCAAWLTGLATGAFVTTAPDRGFRWTWPRRVTAGVAAAVVFVPYAWYTVDTGWAAATDRLGGSEKDIWRVTTRDVAHWLRGRLGAEPGVVLSSPPATTLLAYHGGLRGLGTFYWENRAGLAAAAELYAAPTEAAARARVAQRGVTHIVILPWESFAEPYVRLARGWRADRAVAQDTFVFRLLAGETPPDWLRPVYYPMPEHPALENRPVRVFEVVPGQGRAEAQVRRAQYLLAAGQAGAADTLLRTALAGNPRYLPALIALAQTQLLRGQNADCGATFGRIQQNLADMDGLELGDRVGLAVLSDAVGELAQARAVLGAGWAQADERALRRLEPRGLFALLLLTQKLQPTGLRPGLFQLGLSLLPNEELRQAVRTGTPAP
jgi:hypothetical protein